MTVGAAVLADQARFAGRKVAIVCSGGNISPAQLAALLADLDACDAARAGLVGRSDILEHPDGFLANFSSVPLPDAVDLALGRRCEEARGEEHEEANVLVRRLPGLEEVEAVELTVGGDRELDLVGGRDVAGQLADIFSTDIDFHSDLRKGDRFTVVYEMLYDAGELVGQRHRPEREAVVGAMADRLAGDAQKRRRIDGARLLCFRPRRRPACSLPPASPFPASR